VVDEASQPRFTDVVVGDGALRVARFGDGPSTVLGLHGITGSCIQLAPVARRVGPGVTLIAPDLRGRGASNHLPGPYGMQVHAEDCAAVIESSAEAPVVVLGESMGAYVAVLLAARRPELVARLVLADGGIPVPVPPGIDADALLSAVLGPAVARLDQVFANVEDYFDFWRAHPAVGEEWSSEVEAYLVYDLEPVPGGLRSRARAEAVRADGAQHVLEPTLIEDALRSVACPITLLRAPRNLLNEPTPMLPESAVAPWRQLLDDFADEVVDDTNHYTLMLGDRGARRIAQVVDDKGESTP